MTFIEELDRKHRQRSYKRMKALLDVLCDHALSGDYEVIFGAIGGIRGTIEALEAIERSGALKAQGE